MKANGEGIREVKANGEGGGAGRGGGGGGGGEGRVERGDHGE